MLRNEICRHCKYKRFTCTMFRCDPYKEAKMKQKERWYNRAFPIEDYDGEDRYVAGLIFKATIMALILGFALFSSIKMIGEWFR